MRARGARDLAREVLGRLEREDAWATPALSAALARSSLGPEDRALTTELVYGVLRQRARLDRALTAYMPRGLPKRDHVVANALRIAAYQLLMLDRIPAHAAVDDAVGAIKLTRGASMAGFANAVLRKLATGGEPALPPPGPERVAVEHSLPPWMVSELAAVVPAAELDAAAAALSAPAPLSLRAAGQTSRDALIAALAAERPGAILTPSPLLPEALLARGLAQPFDTTAARSGHLVVQDLGAQLIARLLGPGAGPRILDACAGRGGKTLHLMDLYPEAEITASDLSPGKLDELAGAASQLGMDAPARIACDLTDSAAVRAALAPPYHAVLLDAPCSGLGVLRRHPEAKQRRSATDPARLAALTARIVDQVAPLVAPGGVLVFAVCTFTRAETEQQLAGLLARHPFTLEPPPPAPGVSLPIDARGVLTSFPHRHDADAFFAARLRRAT